MSLRDWCSRSARACASLTLALLAAIPAATASAQSVVDPEILEFGPSPEHWTVSTDGAPVVSGYTLALYLEMGNVPIQTFDLGKPPLDADGKVRVALSPTLRPWPLPLVTYSARVSARGRSGDAASERSNPFMFEGPCAFSASLETLAFAATGGSGAIVLLGGSACAWSASSTGTWVTFPRPNGTGAGSVAFTVAPNTTSSSRSTEIAVGGLRFTLTQAATTCAVSVSPSSRTAAATASTGTFAVTAPAGCQWTTSSGAPWLTLTPASGTGSASVTFAAQANSTTTQRTATATIGGKAVTVTQSAGAGCSFALDDDSGSFPSKAATVTLRLTTGQKCSWTAVSSVSWATVSPRSGTGSASIKLSISQNRDKVLRRGSLNVAGRTFTFEQNR